MKLQGSKINFLGDSITEGVGTSGPEKRFTELIAAETGAVCLNYGISGTRLAKQTRPSDEPSFDLDYCRRAGEMDPEADAVVVFGGTNDFGHGDAPIGCFEDRTPDTFCGAVHFLVRELLEVYPADRIVFLTPLHRWNENDPRGDCKTEDVGTLADYIAKMRQILEYYSIPVLDLYASSGMQPAVPAIREKYMPDGLHPNDKGHEIIASRLIAVLKML